MIVCMCHGLSDREIREEIEAGARSVRKLKTSCGASDDCGACAITLRQMLRERGHHCPGSAPTQRPQ